MFKRLVLDNSKGQQEYLDYFIKKLSRKSVSPLINKIKSDVYFEVLMWVNFENECNANPMNLVYNHLAAHSFGSKKIEFPQHYDNLVSVARRIRKNNLLTEIEYPVMTIHDRKYQVSNWRVSYSNLYEDIKYLKNKKNFTHIYRIEPSGSNDKEDYRIKVL